MQKFSILSLLWVVFFVVLAGAVLSHYLERNMLERDGAITTDFVRFIVRQRLSARDFHYPVPSEERFSGVFREIESIPEIVDVRAYDTEGIVVWAGLDALVGRSFKRKRGLERALRGEMAVELTARRDRDESYLEGHGTLVEIFIPVIENGELVGAVSAYKSSATFFRNLERARRTVWLMSAAGGVLFYVSFFSLFYRSYRLQRRMDEGLRRLNSELSALNAVAATVSRSLDVEELLDLALRKVVELAGARGGWAALGADGGFVVASSAGEVDAAARLRALSSEGVFTAAASAGGAGATPRLFRDSSWCSVCVPLVSRDRVLGFLELVHPPGRAADLERRLSMLASIGGRIGVALENALLYKDLKEFNVVLERTVEERTRELRRSRDEIKAVFDAVTDIIIVRDMECSVVMANRAAATHFGPEPVVGRKCHALFKGEDRPCAECAASARLFYDRGARSLELTNAATGEVYSLSLFPVFDDTGAVRAVIEYAKVVTEQKRMEEKVIQLDKLTSLGGLVGEIAHQINNPLVGVVNYAQMALKQVEPESPVREELETIVRAGKECRDIIKKLLDFSRPASFDLHLLDCNALLDETLRMFERQLSLAKRNIEVVKEYSPGLPPVRVDRTLMIQVFFNIINNAREAMGGGGTIRLATALVDGWLEVTIADTGPGMDEEALQYIFSPFYTTKRASGGTGLGLSVVSNIVSRHKGKVWAESRPGRGTVFRIRLPVELEAC